MKSVASRELRNHTRRLLERVEAGEDLAITVDGRPVARITGLASRRRRWIARAAFFDAVEAVRADTRLAADLGELAPETTDDLDPL
ncbi:MAG: type II toxin-antitoxin system prevent-host-death family antitoxin [Trueperaceae bacterium]